MAHGKKRWIRTFDGKLKRSNDRTKKDYYRNLAEWEPMTPLRKIYGWNYGKKGEFCPQCKHNAKAIQAHNEAYEAAVEVLRQEFALILRPEIEEFERKFEIWKKTGKYATIWGGPPRNPEEDYSRFWKYRAENEHRLPPRPMHDERTYLCPKHRMMFDTQRDMWFSDHLPGRKANYQDTIRQNYRDYRAEVKNLMRQERYDDIPPYKHNYRD